jgi:ribonuclease HI
MFDGGSRGNPGISGSGAYVTTTSYDECQLAVPGQDAATTALTSTNSSSSSASVTARHVVKARHYVGPKCTNNEAEYDGLCTGLAIAKEQVQDLIENRKNQHNNNGTGGDRLQLQLIIEGDSQLIIRQLTGVYACRHVKLKPLFAAAQTFVQEIQTLVLLQQQQQQQQQQQSVNNNNNNNNTNDHPPKSSTMIEVLYQHVLRGGNSVADGK